MKSFLFIKSLQECLLLYSVSSEFSTRKENPSSSKLSQTVEDVVYRRKNNEPTFLGICEMVEGEHLGGD